LTQSKTAGHFGFNFKGQSRVQQHGMRETTRKGQEFRNIDLMTKVQRD
jgi:hypothetical protein